LRATASASSFCSSLVKFFEGTCRFGFGGAFIPDFADSFAFALSDLRFSAFAALFRHFGQEY
jgi:hypothetical protein